MVNTPEGPTRPIVHAVYHPGGGRPLPTVVAIHGHGANGFDLLGLAPYLAEAAGDEGLLVICPQAEFVLQPGAPSFTWFETQPGGRPGQRTPEEFERVALDLAAFVETAVPSYGGDPERVVLLGFSQGGTLAYRLGLGAPSRYRGIATLSTWMPPEAEEHADRDGSASLPILIQHGTEDPLVDVERARDTLNRLVAMGIEPEYHEYPMAHEIRPSSLGDLTAWIGRVLRTPPRA